MELPFSPKRNLVLDPALTDDEASFVDRWRRWQYDAVVLGCCMGIILIMLILPLVVHPPSRLIMGVMLAMSVVVWLIVFDYRVIHPVWVVRKLRGQRRVIELRDGVVWQTYAAALERINHNVPERHRQGLHTELYCTMRGVMQIDAVLELHDVAGLEPNVSAYQEALVRRDRELAAIVQRIALYDDNEAS